MPVTVTIKPQFVFHPKSIDALGPLARYQGKCSDRIVWAAEEHSYPCTRWWPFLLSEIMLVLDDLKAISLDEASEEKRVGAITHAMSKVHDISLDATARISEDDHLEYEVTLAHDWVECPAQVADAVRRASDMPHDDDPVIVYPLMDAPEPSFEHDEKERFAAFLERLNGSENVRRLLRITR